MGRESKNLIKTILITGFSAVLSFLISFFLTSFVTEKVGVEAYGFVSIAKTTVSYAQIITVALTTFIVRYISINYHKGNYEEAEAYYTSSLLACVFLAGSIFLLALIGIFNIDFFLNVSQELVSSVKVLFIFVFMAFFVNTVVTPLNSANYIKNRLDLLGIIKIFSYIVEAVCLVLFLKLVSQEIWVVGFGSFLAALTIFWGSYILKKKLLPDINFDRKKLALDKIFNMMSNGIWQSINSLGNVLNSGLDLIISNLMLTGVQTGEIAIVKTLETLFSTIYSVTGQAFQPRLLRKFSNDNTEEFIDELCLAMKVSGLFSNIGFAGFIALGMVYFKLWLPNQNTILLYKLAIITICTSVTQGCMFPLYYVNTLTLKKKIPCFVTLTSGVLNTISMYLLLRFTALGPYAIVLTTAVIMGAINSFFIPIYCARCLNIAWYTFYPQFFKHLLALTLLIIVFWGIKMIYLPSSWITLIVEALIMSVVGAVIHIMIVTNRREKNKIINRIIG